MATIRNETDRTNLIGRVEKLTGEEKALWGRMTINQMMSHLVQSGDLPFVATLPDKSNFMIRTFLKPLVLYVLPMPKEVKTSPEMDQQEQGREPQDFEEDKRLATDSINRLAAISADHDCLHHPFFGKMSAKEWAVIGYKHIDHHLRQFGV